MTDVTTGPVTPAVLAATQRKPVVGDVRRRTLWLGPSVALVVGGFCAASAMMLYELRQSTRTQAVSSETSVLNVLSQDIARNVEVYDLSLQAVADGLKEPELTTLSPHLQDALLYDRAASAKDLGAILVLDRDGRVVRGSRREAVGADLGDREYFLAQKAAPDQGLFISAPFTRRVTGEDEVIALSRALKGADGGFAGVVVGTMRLDYFRRMFAQADVGPHGSVHLLRTDGMSLMRVPYDAKQSGRDFSASPVFAHLRAARSGSFDDRSTVTGDERIFSFAHVADLPLVLDVAFAEDDVFAAWRTKASVIAAALAALCATAAGLAWHLRRQTLETARAQAMLARSEAQYRLFADNTQDVIIRLDGFLNRTYVSPAISDMLGYKPEQLMDSSFANIVHPEDWPDVAMLLCTAMTARSRIEAVYRLHHEDGRYIWVEGRYSPTPDGSGFTVVLRDVSQRKATEQELARVNAELVRAANTDALTGLANRRAFDAALDRGCEQAGTDGRPLSLLLIDVDRFKAYNDRYGHPEGDACLRRIASALRGSLRRPGDLVARYGGEELAVVLPDTDEPIAAQIAERVRTAIEALRIQHDGNSSCGGVVTASFGCATLKPGSGDGSKELLALADTRLYEAKRLGRNRVGIAAPHAAPAATPDGEADRLRALSSYLHGLSRSSVSACGEATPAPHGDVARWAHGP